MSASSRMLTLLSMLQARSQWTGRLLADRLEVTTRTVRRDIDRLRELGYRIVAVKGPEGGYRLEPGAELPPLLFDDEQAVAVAVALQNAVASGVDIGEAANRALLTVRQVMPSRLRHRIDGIHFVSDSEFAITTAVDPGVLQMVSDAVLEHMVLRFEYQSNDDGSHPRLKRTEPHGLVARRGRWYLVAWELGSEADGTAPQGNSTPPERTGHAELRESESAASPDLWRIYRLDRMHPRKPAGPKFTPRPVPAGDAGTFVNARAKGAKFENRWPCTGVVEMSLPASKVSPWIADGYVEPISDGSCRVTMGSWSWQGLLAQIVKFDAPFRIIDPPDLAAAGRKLSARLNSPSC